MSELRFDDRVALVTGGGGSIGTAHAELLKERRAFGVELTPVHH